MSQLKNYWAESNGFERGTQSRADVCYLYLQYGVNVDEASSYGQFESHGPLCTSSNHIAEFSNACLAGYYGLDRSCAACQCVSSVCECVWCPLTRTQRSQGLLLSKNGNAQICLHMQRYAPDSCRGGSVTCFNH
jgi:hypothetical protein